MAHLNLPPTIRSFRSIIWLMRELHKARKKVRDRPRTGQLPSQRVAQALLFPKKVLRGRALPNPNGSHLLLPDRWAEIGREEEKTQTHLFWMSNVESRVASAGKLTAVLNERNNIWFRGKIRLRLCSALSTCSAIFWLLIISEEVGT